MGATTDDIEWDMYDAYPTPYAYSAGNENHNFCDRWYQRIPGKESRMVSVWDSRASFGSYSYANYVVNASFRPAIYVAYQSITLSEEVVRLIIGDTISLGYKNHISSNVTWTTSNPEVATVTNDGIVTGHKPGLCKVIVSDGNTCDMCLVGIYRFESSKQSDEECDGWPWWTTS